MTKKQKTREEAPKDKMKVSKETEDTTGLMKGDIVVPGDVVGEGSKSGDFTFIDGKEIKASVFGLKQKGSNSVGVIPLSGVYMPKKNDMVIGVVSRIVHRGWIIDIHAPYSTMMNSDEAVRSSRGDRRGYGRSDGRRGDRRGGYDRRNDMDDVDLRKFYKEGDIVSVKILSVDEVRNSYAGGPYKLNGGRIITVSPKKVPRVIGKKKSMLSLIRDKTGCKVVVGQNGVIWINGDSKMMDIVVDTIFKISRESHITGLTNQISDYLDDQVKVFEKTKTKKKKKEEN